MPLYGLQPAHLSDRAFLYLPPTFAPVVPATSGMRMTRVIGGVVVTVSPSYRS